MLQLFLEVVISWAGTIWCVKFRFGSKTTVSWPLDEGCGLNLLFILSEAFNAIVHGLLKLCFSQILCAVNWWNVEGLMFDCTCSGWYVGCWNHPALYSQRLLSFLPFTRWSECPGRDHDSVWYRENKETCCQAGWVTGAACCPLLTTRHWKYTLYT